MKLTKRELLLMSFASAKSDWTRERAAAELKTTENELENAMKRVSNIEYFEDCVEIPR